MISGPLSDGRIAGAVRPIRTSLSLLRKLRTYPVIAYIREIQRANGIN